jgi:hypothetical protein
MACRRLLGQPDAVAERMENEWLRETHRPELWLCKLFSDNIRVHFARAPFIARLRRLSHRGLRAATRLYDPRVRRCYVLANEGHSLGVHRLRVSIAAQPAAPQNIDLAERLTVGKLRIVNREVTRIPERNGIHLSGNEGGGVVIWIEGSDFKTGTIEVDVRGRDEFQRSFVGLAFHGNDDKTYEAVYLRPFNFRADDPVRKQHAVQYISLPDYDWQRLRKEFPEEFENPVDASIVPTDWVRLRIVVQGQKIQIYVGATQTPALEVRKLGQLDGGMVGLWAAGESEFANLVIGPPK